ncbi:FMN reductase [Dyella flava]|uniref:FMN reductase n=1 Tax=Dyella flava TaxID=1920170 RepID=A0ABS2K0P1_9GAMM|nr:FMN reductase [Dyella flava]MBM7124459.1 FMN reductase [Dyella flava]
MLVPLQVVAVIGSTSPFSRTLVLARAMLDALSCHLPLESHVVELTRIARPLGQSIIRSELPLEVEKELQRIESADLVLAAAPVYRGSYPGLFKHLFDLIDTDALVNVPVLLAATGGSERHALVIEHQLRPLFGFMQALTLPIGVYGTPPDFEGERVTDPLLLERIAVAAERAAAVLGGSKPATNKRRLA